MNIWKKLRQNARTDIVSFLEQREDYCVSAISRLNYGTIQNMWAVFESGKNTESSVCAMLLYGKRLLFPVFNFSSGQMAEYKKHGVPMPRFLPLILKNDLLHAAQGMADDMDILEITLKKKHIIPVSQYDYELRSLDYTKNFPLKSPAHRPGTGLVIRRAYETDANELYPLQAGYEKEEVLPRGAEFNPAVCRRILESLIADNLVLTAELDGKLVGKININAASYNRFQIGGNYVLPEYRSRGIAQAMTAALIREFAQQKNQFSLFVKKANIPARRVYDNLGFTVIGDYRISYFA